MNRIFSALIHFTTTFIAVLFVGTLVAVMFGFSAEQSKDVIAQIAQNVGFLAGVYRIFA